MSLAMEYLAEVAADRGATGCGGDRKVRGRTDAPARMRWRLFILGVGGIGGSAAKANYARLCVREGLLIFSVVVGNVNVSPNLVTAESAEYLPGDECGCDIVAVPHEILKKSAGALRNIPLDTAKMLAADAIGAGFEL